MSFRAPVTVYRAGVGSWSAGFYDPGDADSETVYASIQPLDPVETQALSEGRRITAAYILYSDTKLLVGAVGVQPDCVVIDNEHFEVFSSERWQNTPLRHYKMIVVAPISDEHSQ